MLAAPIRTFFSSPQRCEVPSPRPALSARLERNREAAGDEVLLGWAAGGDRLAFDALTRRHLPRLYAIALRIVRQPALAEEVAQETMLRVWRHAARFDPERAAFTTWVYRIAVNLALNRVPPPLSPPLEAAALVADPADGPEEHLQAKEDRARVLAALAGLPDRQRAALALFYDQALSGQDAAAALNVSRRALEGLLRRARRQLAAALQRPPHSPAGPK